MTTIDEMAIITLQYQEIAQGVADGSLDPAAVRQRFQGIIESKVPSSSYWNLPIWWRTPDQQLERAHELWPNVTLPQPPTEFRAQTETEVPLLHVPDTFDSLWSKIVAQKYRDEEVRSDDMYLRIAPNKHEYTSPVWLAFDPEHGKGKRPDSFWGEANIAASEVLSALVQFPEWQLDWFDEGPAPSIAGYQLKCNDHWRNVPCLRRGVDDRLLKLRVRKASNCDVVYSSPSVREF